MNTSALPPGWTIGAPVTHEEIYSDPPRSPDSEKVQFYGLLDGDTGHRLYSMPVDTKVGNVVRLFRVGSHGAQSYGYDQNATINLVAEKTEAIAAMIPCRVTFADPAGLKLKFERKITDGEVRQIERLFPADIQMQAGLDLYISEWDGTSPLLQPVLKENMIHFWWD